MKDLQNVLEKMGILSLTVVVLSGCGPNAEEIRATKVLAICDEANTAMSALSSSSFTPVPSADWEKIGNTYAEISSKLQTLSSQASELEESQLSRDFSSVSNNLGEIQAVAALAKRIGASEVYNDYWFPAVAKLLDNSALRGSSNRTFVECKSN
jgi:hypothetical protein